MGLVKIGKNDRLVLAASHSEGVALLLACTAYTECKGQ